MPLFLFTIETKLLIFKMITEVLLGVLFFSLYVIFFIHCIVCILLYIYIMKREVARLIATKN